MGSEVLALDRIASLAKKLKDLNSAGVHFALELRLCARIETLRFDGVGK